MKVLLFSAALAVAVPAATSLADDHVASNDTSDGYGYWFPTDSLQAPDGAGGVPIIKVRPPSARATLIRPRVQFVAELLKTVENL